jgi:hypothetical protein
MFWHAGFFMRFLGSGFGRIAAQNCTLRRQAAQVLSNHPDSALAGMAIP